MEIGGKITYLPETTGIQRREPGGTSIYKLLCRFQSTGFRQFSQGQDAEIRQLWPRVGYNLLEK